MDVIGGLNLKRIFNEKALALFIRPPSVEILHQRLRNRSTDSEEKIATRIAKAEYELSFAPQFDKILVNDDLATALLEAEKLVQEFLTNEPFDRIVNEEAESCD